MTTEELIAATDAIAAASWVAELLLAGITVGFFVVVITLAYRTWAE